MSIFISIENLSKEEFSKLLEDILDAKFNQYKNPTEPEYLTVQDVSNLLSVSELTVYNYIKRGLIQSQKIGRRHVIDRDAFQKSLAEVKSFKYSRNE